MIINVTYDSSVTATGGANPCPTAAFEAVVAGAVKFYESQFSDPITINIDVGWGLIPGGNGALTTGGAASVSNYNGLYTYAQVRTALISDAKSAADTTAVASLASTDPTGGATFSMTLAESKALGLSTATTGFDGYIGLASQDSWSFMNTTNTDGSNVTAGQSDAFSFVAHEISEVMGRQLNFDVSDGAIGGGYFPYDLFDYSKAGVRALTHSATAGRYFSIDGGATNNGQHTFNSVAASGDLFDWQPNATADSYDFQGSVGAVSTADLSLMDVLGYDPASPSTAIHWTKAISGAFTTAADWTGAVAPGPSNDAILDAPGATAYTVTSSTTQTVASIQTAATATLAITGGRFNATNGTGAGANAGLVVVSRSADLVLGGVFTNTKVISLDGGSLLVAAGGSTLTGAGELILRRADAIEGVSSGATLTNQSRIWGIGQVGEGQMTLFNDTGGVIESSGTGQMTIDTGSNSLTNAGVIEAAGPVGGLNINSMVDNSGDLIASSAVLKVIGAVIGGGIGVIAGSGTLDFGSTFNERVTFAAGSTGRLELAHSTAYTLGVITGLSTTGANSLDLGDISFINTATTTAKFSGGILTVTDGTHTAKINLIGNYTGHTFTTSSDGNGGTIVVDPAGPTSAAPALASPVHAFVAAMASLAPAAAAQTHGRDSAERAMHGMLVAPRFTQAA